MFYFSNFPTIKIKDQNVTNIFKRFDFINEFIKNDIYYDILELVEGETFETIAERMYGNSNYSWLILIANREINPFFINYKSDAEMMKYIKGKYGNHLYDTYILITTEGKPVDEVDQHYYNNNKFNLTYKNIVPITYERYEKEVNYSKRFIKVIKSRYLSQIENELKTIFSEGS